MNRYIGPGKAVAVAGFGKTGKGVLDFLLARGGGSDFELYLYNDTPIDEPARQQYKQRGVTFLVGGDRFIRLADVERIVLSPGVDGRTPRFDRLRQRGIEIISEIELASSFLDAGANPIIAVTGTNGKSTTVSLIHHILTQCGVKSFLTGNIGTPLISRVEDISGNRGAVVVLEASSFQLEEIIDFRPYIGVLLNVTPDHLDRYATTGDYFSAKLNLVKNQGGNDYLVLNHDDPVLRENAETEPKRWGFAGKFWFSRSLRSPEAEVSTWLSGDTLYLRLKNSGPTGDAGVEKISLRDNPLRGVHNLENIMAAVTAARLLGAGTTAIENSIPGFRGLPHRMQSLGKIGKVEFINDSKATNVDAALKSIAGIHGPMVVILGGKDKGGDFRILGPVVNQRVEKVLLVGQAADKIRGQLGPAPMEAVPDFDRAVERGRQILEKKGGVVLLAPGCASFDMFDNFEHRGDMFKEAFLRLKQAKEKKEKKKKD